MLEHPKIVCIMPVWDEQNMVSLAIASSKEIVYQYIILIKKGIDKTKEVVEYCKKIWNLNMIIIESDLRLRERKKYAIEISKDYADYYLLQDGDEIFYNHTNKPNDIKNIIKLIKEDYTFGFTSILFLEKDLLHTPKDENQIWLIPHPFFFKNTKDIFWPNVGDMPCYDANMSYHKIYNTGCKNTPFKFDAKIKNFRRVFLREVFTDWHDSGYDGTIEEYADKYHHTVKWYRENVDVNLDLEEIIRLFEIHTNQNDEEKFRWHKIYDEKTYGEYPYIIKKFIEFNKLEGIETLDDLSYLDKL
jgi:predicted RNA-binding protein with PUA-like domain